jgi:hypothetical protein
MFKVGDKVRCISVCGGAAATVGRTYIIARRQTRADSLVFFTGDHNSVTAMYASRFELVTPEELNVSSATDQELADEYRRRRDELREVYEVLTERGYTVNSQGGTTSIFKVETTKL